MFEVAVSREKKPDLISKLIMWWTGADFSHSLIIEGSHTVWHATGKGFHREPLHEFLKKREIVGRLPLPSKSHRLAYVQGWLDGKRDVEYSESQYLGFLLPWKWVRKLFANGRSKTICSEIQYQFCVECFFMPDDVPDEDYIDPKTAWLKILKWLRGI